MKVSVDNIPVDRLYPQYKEVSQPNSILEMISCRYFDSKDRTDLSFLNTDSEAVVWTIVTNVNMNTNSGNTFNMHKKTEHGAEHEL